MKTSLLSQQISFDDYETLEPIVDEIAFYTTLP